jgi:demethylmenaquinone methyltransferase/2-methoxy-6-polyprenyl-1,4-benzoquinol methylase
MQTINTIKPYDENAAKKEQVRTMFNRIAFRYDLLNRLLSFGIDRYWRKKTVAQVTARHPKSVLDVATGTGDLALGLARAIPTATVTGVDLSADMLAIGRRKIEKKGLTNVAALIEGDGEHLPFATGAFEAVTTGFGIRNFENIPAGLAEMYRVLQPGGSVHILEFSMPRETLFGALYHFYFRRMLPFIGGLLTGEYKAYRYLQRSVEDFPSGDRFAALMQQAGFTALTQTPLTRGLTILYCGKKA